MFFGGENINEFLKYQIESVHGFFRSQVRQVRLFLNDQLQFRYDVRDDFSVRPEGGKKFFSPGLYFLFAFRNDLANESLKRLNDGAEGNILAELIVFPKNEISLLGNNRFVNLIHQGGFADARLAGYQHHLT